MLDDLWLHDLHQDRSILYGLTLNNYISHARQDDGMVDLSILGFYSFDDEARSDHTMDQYARPTGR